MAAQLGSLEETILLLVLIMGEEEAYGVSIVEAYNDKMQKGISVPAVHTVLKRLEDKGMIKSKFGSSSPTRGGKKKRIYTITKLGYGILTEVKENRTQLWSMAPAVNFSR
jgi:DNA-binding PadR family transcriptional regulator